MGAVAQLEESANIPRTAKASPAAFPRRAHFHYSPSIFQNSKIPTKIFYKKSKVILAPLSLSSPPNLAYKSRHPASRSSSLLHCSSLVPSGELHFHLETRQILQIWLRFRVRSLGSSLKLSSSSEIIFPPYVMRLISRCKFAVAIAGLSIASLNLTRVSSTLNPKS